MRAVGITLIAISLLLGFLMILMICFKGNYKMRLYHFFDKLYSMLTRIPVVGNNLSTIYRRLYENSPGDSLFIRYKSVLYFLISTLVFLLVFGILYFMYAKDLYMLLINLLIAVYLRSVILDSLIGDDTKLLKEFIAFLTDVKHSFQMHGMVQSAVLEAIDKASPSMNIMGKKIYESLLSEEDLNRFNTDTLNRHIKNFVGESYLTKEYGDKKLNKVSLYLTNTNYIISEIRIELKKRSGLRYRLINLGAFSVIPVFFPNLIDRMIIGTFPDTELFYGTMWGTIAKFFLLILSFVCFAVIRYLKKTGYSSLRIGDMTTWDQFLLKKKLIKRLAGFFIPKEGKRDYYRLQDLLQESASPYDIHGLALRRMLCMILTFVLSINLFISLHKTNAQAIVNQVFSSVGQAQEMIVAKGEIVDEKEVYKAAMDGAINKSSKTVDAQEILSVLKNKGVEVSDPEVTTQVALLIQNAQTLLNSYYAENFKWWELILSLLISLVGMTIPTLILVFKKNMRKNDLEEEVFQFDTIILLLMHHEKTSVLTILEWMERFADIYYNPIRKCLSSIQQGTVTSLKELRDPSNSKEETKFMASQQPDLLALEKLKETVKYKSFTRLVDKLIAADEIGVSQAFESLESERTFYVEERKEAVERTIRDRGAVGELVGFIPFYANLLLYLVFPLLWVASESMDNLSLMLK